VACCVAQLGFNTFDPAHDVVAGLGLDNHLRPNEKVLWVGRPSVIRAILYTPGFLCHLFKGGVGREAT